MRINAKVAFKQVPEVLDTSQGGNVELQIQNLTSKPLKVLSVVSQNRTFTIDDDIPPSIGPGKSGRLLIHYAAQSEPAAATIVLSLSETFGRSPLTVVPLNIKMSTGDKDDPVKREVERIIKTTPKPALPGR